MSQPPSLNPLCPRCLAEMSFESSTQAGDGKMALKFRCMATVESCDHAVEVVAASSSAIEFIRSNRSSASAILAGN